MDDNLLKIIGASITALFATIVAILLYFLKKKDDELSLIKNKISDEKYKTYFSIVSLFFDILKQGKGLSTFKDGELAAKYIDIKKNLLLLGSDDILKSLIKETDYVDVKELINKVDNLERQKKSKRQPTNN